MLPSELTNVIEQFIGYVHRNEARFTYIRVYHTNVLEADNIYKNPPPNVILTTNLAAVVCVCAKFEHFLALRSYFESIRPENFVRIAKFKYAAFGPLFAFHCP